MSHTPGPWWYDEETSTIRGSLPAYWEDPSDKTADKAPIFALHGACSGEDIPANIRLAVSAPELLEALRFYANPNNWWRDYSQSYLAGAEGGEPSISETDGGELAREAIRKALGDYKVA